MKWTIIVLYVLCLVAVSVCYYTITQLDDVYDKCYAKVVEMCGQQVFGYKNYTIIDGFNYSFNIEVENNGT